MRLYDWTWWVSQLLALVGLVFTIISFQQNSSKRIIGFRCIATAMIFSGVCFFGDLTAIILNATSLLRNAIALYAACHPKPIRSIEVVICAYIIFVLIFMNIVFWQGYLSVISIIVAILKLISFVQSSPKYIRILSAMACVVAVLYYSLLMSPINIAIETFSLIAIIVGMIRFDYKREDLKFDN